MRHTGILCSVLITFAFASIASGEDTYEDSATSGTQLTEAMIAATDTIAQVLDRPAPKGWTPVGDVERYVPENLYDKINGRSELYMAYDVVGLAFVSYVNDNDPSQYLDVYLYDMATPLNAFGIFSVERSGEAPAIDVGREGYRSAGDFIYWKGAYYVTVIGPDDSAESQALCLDLAKSIAADLKDNGYGIWGKDVLPAKDRIESSIQYFFADALSLDFLNNTFTATYKIDGEEIRVFLSKQPAPEVAADVYRKYVEYLDKYAEGLATAPGEVAIASADTGAGYYDAVFQTGPYVAGIVALQNRERAVEAARALHAHLSTKEK